MTIELLTPGGRLVWGNPAKAFPKKDQRTKQPVIKDGKQVDQWSFGIAIPKAEFNAKVWPALDQEARTAYPQGVPNGFSWKIKDGDGIDRAGKPYANREGYAGCFVLNIATEAFAPPIYKFENGAYRQINAEEIKTGDYIAVHLNVKVNVPRDSSHTPGLYINPNGVQFVGYGPAIQSNSNPDEMFGGTQIALPAGASATPLVSHAPMPGTMPAGQPAYQPAAQPQHQYAPAPQYAPQPQMQQPVYQPAQPQYAPQAALPAPAHDFVHNAGMPAGQPAYQPAAQPQHQYAPAPQYAPPAGAPGGGYMPGMPQR